MKLFGFKLPFFRKFKEDPVGEPQTRYLVLGGTYRFGGDFVHVGPNQVILRESLPVRFCVRWDVCHEPAPEILMNDTWKIAYPTFRGSTVVGAFDITEEVFQSIVKDLGGQL